MPSELTFVGVANLVMPVEEFARADWIRRLERAERMRVPEQTSTSAMVGPAASVCGLAIFTLAPVRARSEQGWPVRSACWTAKVARVVATKLSNAIAGDPVRMDRTKAASSSA